MKTLALISPEDSRVDFHYRGDVRDILNDGWDLIIMHPPCTHTALCGNRWYWNSPLRLKGAEFCTDLWERACDVCDHVALEQPKTIMQRYIGPRTQTIQPHQFGHRETKETWLWLKNLPPLQPTKPLEPPYEQRIWKMSPGPNRGHERARTYPGIAMAMADQWSKL